MNSLETLLISRNEVANLLEIGECMKAVETAFGLYAEGKAQPPKVLGMHVLDGGFHIKAGVMNLSRNYFVAKINANFPNNMKSHGFPTIQGAVVVCDADTGRLLALMDSMEITIIRTGAATGVAAQYLARKNSSVITICGCGNQGRISIKAISNIRKIETVFAYDISVSAAEKLARELSQELQLKIIVVDDLRKAVAQSDICVTCTSSKKPLLMKDDIRQGTFIAAVGADYEGKQELDPMLIASSKLVTDLTEQSATMGDFHHALEKGLVTRSHVHGELGEIIAGNKPGRTSEDEVIVFDSTGTALQDVAAAAIVYEKAIANKSCKTFEFGK